MRARWVPFLLASLPVAVQGQTSIGAGDVLERSIRYHDPSARWPTFARRLELHESRPNGEERVVYVSIDKPNITSGKRRRKARDLGPVLQSSSYVM